MVKTEEEGYLLCHSEAKEAKEMAIFERRTKKFEDELQKIKEGLGKKGTQKSYEKILERIGRLKEKYENERRAWKLFYDTVSVIEDSIKAENQFGLELRQRAFNIVNGCLLKK